MDILQIAIKEAGGSSKLAATLGVVPSAIGNWKERGLPKPWELALSLKYKNAIKKYKDSHISADCNLQFRTALGENT